MSSGKQPDLFGLVREAKIIKSGVREVFTPHRPVKSVELFFGRQKEVQSIIEQINTPGQHSLLYGERGVGKSSLANVSSYLLFSELVEGKLYMERCDSSTSFESILQSALKDADVDITIRQIDSSRQEGKSAKISIKVAEGQLGTEQEVSEMRNGPAVYVSPSLAADVLGKTRGLLVVDEADALDRPVDKKRLAEFIKLLSDSDAQFKVLIVGVAETGEELIAGHESVSRCLRETRLDRMPDNELALIIAEGAKKLKLSFDESVIDAIVKLSAGYPHFTHLLALKCAEDAVAEGYIHVEKEHLRVSMSQAVEDAVGSLKRAYMNAVRSYGTDQYRIILCAAASIEKTEFSARELREVILQQTGQEVSQQSLNNYFQRLVSDGTSTIIRRTAKGVYRFNDPRMPSYIKIANQVMY